MRKERASSTKYHVQTTGDSRGLTVLLAGMLAEHGAQVTFIEGGEGVSLFVRLRSPDAIVLDLTAPEPNGPQVPQDTNRPGCKSICRTVLVTAYRCNRESVSPRRGCLVAYVTEPFRREAIQAVAEEILSPSISRDAA